MENCINNTMPEEKDVSPTFFDTLIAESGEEIHHLEAIRNRLSDMLDRLRGTTPSEAVPPPQEVPTAIREQVKMLGESKQSLTNTIEGQLTDLETYI